MTEPERIQKILEETKTLSEGFLNQDLKSFKKRLMRQPWKVPLKTWLIQTIKTNKFRSFAYYDVHYARLYINNVQVIMMNIVKDVG